MLCVYESGFTTEEGKFIECRRLNRIQNNFELLDFVPKI
jgi:hypothetical protein